MSAGWFLLGLLAGSGCRRRAPTAAERRRDREDAAADAREAAKWERRERVRAAWDARHPRVVFWRTVGLVVFVLGVTLVSCQFCQMPMMPGTPDQPIVVGWPEEPPR